MGFKPRYPNIAVPYLVVLRGFRLIVPRTPRYFAVRRALAISIRSLFGRPRSCSLWGSLFRGSDLTYGLKSILALKVEAAPAVCGFSAG